MAIAHKIKCKLLHTNRFRMKVQNILFVCCFRYFCNKLWQNEENRRYFQLKKENQKDALPLRLQAYERMTLFLERIEPSKVLTRIAPSNSDKVDYANFVIAQIDQEFEHNLTQQITCQRSVGILF